MAKQVAPEFVVGRDQLIRSMWRTLASRSVVFTAERRIGKTTVMKKMEAEPVEGSLVLYSDLEKVDTPERFVETLLTDLKKHLTKRAKLGQWFGAFFDSIGGLEVGGIIKIPDLQKRGWQSVLEKAIDNVCSNHAESRVVFLWDEIPYMLQKINVSERNAGSNKNSALAILDCLRAMRGEHHNLRMLFTGSVGLHHVLAELRSDQFASQPVNDMEKIDIGPLTQQHAAKLASGLLSSDQLLCDSQEAVVEQLILLTDRVPFYIHRVVSRLAYREETITPAAVEATVSECLTAAADPWEMEHFRVRLKIYYRDSVLDASQKSISTADIAKHLLNHLAVAAEPQSIDQCHAHLKSQLVIEDRDAVITLLSSMSKDHYFKRGTDGRYAFRFPLVQRWWRLAEELNQ